jgi:hypothetical protein
MSAPVEIWAADYDQITATINGLFASNQMAMLSIYSDAAGTVVANDDAGTPIKDLQVTSVSVTKSYIDSVTNDKVNASITFAFSDNSIKVVDDLHVLYYTITGVDFPVRRF